MPPDRKIDVAIWNAPDDDRGAMIAGRLETSGMRVSDLDLATSRPMVLLLLPGTGGQRFADTCERIVEAYPDAPAVVLHTEASEHSHPNVDHHVFELLPASMDVERVAEHVRAVLARWVRFEELKNQATTLQRLESTMDLVYFDFRPDNGTFRPSAQLQQIIGHFEERRSRMAPTPLLDRVHSDDRALFAGTLFEAARSEHALLRPDPPHGHLMIASDYFRVRGRAFGSLNRSVVAPHASSAFARTRPSTCSAWPRRKPAPGSTT